MWRNSGKTNKKRKKLNHVWWNVIRRPGMWTLQRRAFWNVLVQKTWLMLRLAIFFPSSSQVVVMFVCSRIPHLSFQCFFWSGRQTLAPWGAFSEETGTISEHTVRIYGDEAHVYLPWFLTLKISSRGLSKKKQTKKSFYSVWRLWVKTFWKNFKIKKKNLNHF